MDAVTYGWARRRPAERRRAVRCLVIGVLAACTGLLVMAGVAPAKSGSVPIPAPSATTVVLTLSLAGQSYDYTWADVSGSGSLGAAVTQSYLKDTAEQDPQDWSGVWLRTVLADAEARSGITLDDDWKLKVSTVDSYTCALFVGDVQDSGNNYLLAMDPVRGCDTEDPAEATFWYDPTYVRVCTNGDYGNTAYPARLIKTSGSMTVLDAAGNEIAASMTAKLAVSSPTVSQSKATIARGQRLALRAVATKAAGASQAQPIVWSTGNSKVATVTASGAVVAKARGTTVVKATSGACVSGFTVKVVSKAVAATRITLPRSRSLTAGSTARLTARLFPAGATTTIAWKSSNAKVAAVDRGGVVKAVRKGKATITVRTSNGKTARCSVTVK